MSPEAKAQRIGRCVASTRANEFLKGTTNGKYFLAGTHFIQQLLGCFNTMLSYDVSCQWPLFSGAVSHVNLMRDENILTHFLALGPYAVALSGQQKQVRQKQARQKQVRQKQVRQKQARQKLRYVENTRTSCAPRTEGRNQEEQVTHN
jgi:hypothetical protein